MSIADATLRSDFYTTAYHAISSALTSYTIYNSSQTLTLDGSFPDVNNNTFPIINIPPISVSNDYDTLDVTRSSARKHLTLRVFITSKYTKDLDTIATGVEQTMTSTTFQDCLLTNVSDDDGFLEANGQKLKIRTMTFSFIRRS